MISNETFNMDSLTDNENQISTKKLEDFVDRLENGMSEWFKEFNWSKDDLFKLNNEKTKFFTCPFDAGHRNISEKNYEKHILKCRLKSYSMTNQDFLDYNKHPDVNSPFQIVIDKNVQNEIFKNAQENKPAPSNMLPIPFEYNILNFRDEKNNNKNTQNSRDVSLTTNQMFVNYTPAERLLLHEYALSKSKSLGYQNSFEQSLVDLPEETNFNDKGASTSDSVFSKEIKRRPKSYRTGKTKTHTDALRELIDTQMEFLRKSGQNHTEMNIDDSKINKKRDHSRSSSRSESTERLKHHHKEKSTRKKQKKSKK
ncbi:unnamed protein product [Brachionus calyciflorus]|uniref:CHHC U11-48K-type domain-containing protein n=1 Tax=Brachionus calyciflorus TaxID=104777 RepID=A0A814F2R8_9BILA|nr:unnamed protein product [Brachionus calyciflorus]